MLTEQEKINIGNAALDLATGNYLLRPRSIIELETLQEVCVALETTENKRTDRQKEICEEYRMCTDYKYWKSKQTKEEI